MNTTKSLSISMLIFVASSIAVLSIQYTVGLIGTSHYWLGHFFFGLAFPFLGYGVFSLMPNDRKSYPNWVLSRPMLKQNLDGFLSVVTSFYCWLGVMTFWHVGNELWEDQKTRAVFTVDVDHLIAGAVGLMLAAVLYEMIKRMYPDF